MAILHSILREDSVFPAEGREGLAYEGATIGLFSSGAQITHRRTHPLHPETVAERRIDNYNDLEAAIEAFIDSEWNKGIDGLSIRAGS